MNLIALYNYCFYRICNFWCRVDLTRFLFPHRENKSYIEEMSSAAAWISMLQVAHAHILLLILPIFFDIQISANTIVVLVLFFFLLNAFFVNNEKRYTKAKEKWDKEPLKVRKRRKWLVILFMLASFVMMFVSMKYVYKPDSLTIV